MSTWKIKIVGDLVWFGVLINADLGHKGGENGRFYLKGELDGAALCCLDALVIVLREGKL